MISFSASTWPTVVQRRAAELRSALRPWQELPVLARDAIVITGLAPVVFAPALAETGAVLGEVTHRPLDTFGLVVAAGLWIPLVLRRWWPTLSLALVGTAFMTHELLGYPAVMATIGLYLALYSASAHQRDHRRALIAAISVTYVGFAVALMRAGSPQGPDDFLAFYLVMVACWGAGAWVRARQDSSEELRRRSVQAATVQERARIARELHDVVTHHVTAMVIQADAAQFVAGEQSAPLTTGLAAISDTGRRALGDLRHLLGVLNATGETEPENAASTNAGRLPVVGSMRELVEQIRHTGQPVDLTEDGSQPDTGSGAQLAAYRVLQEALTNTLKHAAGRPTSVRIRHLPAGTELEVISRSSAAEVAPAGYRPGPAGGGHGLIGMRQRVELFGGTFEAGSTSDGGFRVWATIPEDTSA